MLWLSGTPGIRAHSILSKDTPIVWGRQMLDDLAGKRIGERIQIPRERKGLTRPVMVGMSARG
jgi:hypothetical protein